MGLDVLSVRCFRHNTSHSAAGGCPLCTREEDEKRARAAELEHEPKRRAQLAANLEAQRAEEARAAAAAAPKPALPPVLQLPPGAEYLDEVVPNHAIAALSRLAPEQLVMLVGELELWRIARSSHTKLQRFPIHPMCIAPTVSVCLSINVTQAARLVRVDVAADEGERVLEHVHVQRMGVGTRTIAEGGTLAQLNRCPLSRETLTPSVGAQLFITNASAGKVTLRGVLIGEVLDYEARSRNVHARRDEYDFDDVEPGPFVGDEYGPVRAPKFKSGRR